MPNWKKIILSGSNAGLSSLFVENAVTASSFYGSGVDITGVISSSYAISASWAPGSSNSLTSSYALTASYIDFPNNLSFVHTQSTPSNRWTVNHNLGVDLTNITVWSSSRVIIPEDIISVSAVTTEIVFPTNQVGYVVVGRGATTSVGSGTSESSSYSTTSSYSNYSVSSSFSTTSSYYREIKTFGISIDGGGSDITTGVKGDIIIPFSCYIDSWYLTSDAVGSIVVDVWKSSFASFPPTVANTIAGGEKPTLSSQQSNSDSNLTTWTRAVSQNDVIRFNVDSVSGISKINLVIKAYI